MRNVGESLRTVQVSLSEMIGVKCLDCCGGDAVMVVECDSPDCPLVHGRPSGRPDGLKKRFWSESQGMLKVMPVPRKRILTEEQKVAATERLKASRAAKSR